MTLLIKSVCIFSVTFCLACNNSNTPIGEPVKKVWPPELRFYYRSGGSNNGYLTFHDYVVLENYVNRTYHLNDLVALARDYLDTAQGASPIDGVTFVGEAPDTRLPSGMYHRQSEHVEYLIVSIAFDSTSTQEKNIGSSKKHVGFVALWKDGESATFSSSTVDSLVKANPLMDNGN